MYRFFKFILGTGLVVTSLWSCSLEDATPSLPLNAVDPLPLVKEFYTQEKPKQVTSSFRIQTEQEIFPFWAGAKIHADGQILIVPAHRKVQVRYEAGYLRRFVFELDERGQVIRGGMLELAGKDSEFLLQNEELLIEGFLAGVKSKDLTYLWSDFVARPLDGTQADGRVVALQREGGGKSRLDAEAQRTEFCIDWYWVYSSNGVVVYEVYSHTTCGSTSCDSDAQDACLDDGTGGGGDDYVFIDNPCDLMEALSKNFDFKKKFEELSHNTGLNYETGYTFSKNGASFTFNYIQGQGNSQEIYFNLSSPIDGFIHSHYSGTLSLFSGTDIRSIYLIYKEGMMNNPLSFSIGVATPQGNSYTLGIEDLNQFLSFAMANFSNQMAFNELEESYEFNYSIFSNIYSNEILGREMAFLETFSGSGLQLFKGNSDFSNFQKLTKTHFTINSQNCN